MEMNVDHSKDYYFICDGVGSSDKNELPRGARVFVMNEEAAFPVPLHAAIPRYPRSFGSQAEGPYESIRQLKDNSMLFKELQNTNPKRAAQIFQDKHLVKYTPEAHTVVSAGHDEEFGRDAQVIIEHTMRPSFNKQDASGMHYYDPLFVKVCQWVAIDQTTGVRSAYVELFNLRVKRWIKKKDVTTFYPEGWSLDRILSECKHAYINRRRITETRHEGISQSGVRIVFIYTSTRSLKTAYPVIG